jgi:hypothetical protein
MIETRFFQKNSVVFACTLLLAIITPQSIRAQAASGQKTFPTASAAAAALAAAARSGNQEELLAILGPAGKDLISSGDPIQDKNAQQSFAKHYAEKHSLSHEAQGIETVLVGPNDWPMPIPIVRDGTSWYFDSTRGREEVLNRRIGENELGAIAVCEGYVQAQKEYASKAHDGLPAGIYAQRLTSTEGKHDGLYWKPLPGQPESPLGPAVAEAAAEGYTGGSGPAPYHGYFYKLLKEQGPDAEGGAKSYLVDGKLSGGFALLAYPANYGNGGIMTFMVDQDGNILQKDLGDDTVNLARQITSYNPGQDWLPAD